MKRLIQNCLVLACLLSSAVVAPATASAQATAPSVGAPAANGTLVPASKLYYNYPIPAFPYSYQPKYDTRSYPEIGVGAGVVNDYGYLHHFAIVFSYFNSEISTGGTELDLETGVIEDHAVHSFADEIRPPAAGGDLPTYLAAMATLRDGLVEARAPQAAVNYCNTVIALLSPPLAADKIQVVRLDHVDFALTTIPVAVKYNASRDRDILVDLFLNDVWIAKDRVSVKAGSGVSQLTIALPAPVDPTTLYVLELRAKLLPSGADYSKYLDDQSEYVQ